LSADDAVREALDAAVRCGRWRWRETPMAVRLWLSGTKGRSDCPVAVVPVVASASEKVDAGAGASRAVVVVVGGGGGGGGGVGAIAVGVAAAAVVVVVVVVDAAAAVVDYCDSVEGEAEQWE
jgi:hypothetical protein